MTDLNHTTKKELVEMLNEFQKTIKKYKNISNNYKILVNRMFQEKRKKALIMFILLLLWFTWGILIGVQI
jgi:uncharacterized ion transporter superfamily protein YfcC